MSDQPDERWHVLFFGQVQGVGFRYTATRVAANLRVTGWVRNLEDGSVELMAEGTRQSLRLLIDGICQTTHGSVTEHTVDKLDATGEFGGFSIRS